MNMKRRKLLCMLVAAVMLLSLAACGKGKNTDPNLLKIGDYELRYKGAEIMTDYDGNDAIVATLDYTNNSKEATTYLWSFVETATQNGTELKGATRNRAEGRYDLPVRGLPRHRDRQPVLGGRARRDAGGSARLCAGRRGRRGCAEL